MNYQVEMYRGKQGLAIIESAWRVLQAKLPDSRFFHRLGWFKSQLENVERDDGSVFFVCISVAGEAVGIFPLRRVTAKRFGIPLQIWELYWANDMGVSDCLFAKEQCNKDLLRVLVRWLKMQKEYPWDLLWLTDTLEDSNVIFGMNEMSRICSLTVMHHYSKYIPCNVDYESVMSRVGGHFRRNVRRQTKKLNTLGDVEYRFVTSRADMDEAFRLFLEAEASSWKGEAGAGTAVRLSLEETAFYRGLLEEFSEVGEGLIALILLDGHCIAAQLALLVGGTIYLLKIGYDEQYHSLGPGNVLLNELIQRYCSNVNAVSFVTGAHWNDNWAPVSMNVYENMIFNSTPRGVTTCMLEKIKDVGRRLKHHALALKPLSSLVAWRPSA